MFARNVTFHVKPNQLKEVASKFEKEILPILRKANGFRDQITMSRNSDETVGISLWNNKADNPGKWPLVKADNPVGEWNTFHIVMKGDRVTVFLNGKKVVDDTPLENYWERGKPLPARGPIELQHHGDKLWFKNIYVKELPDDAGGKKD